jgi:uncharacterized membrane protein
MADNDHRDWLDLVQADLDDPELFEFDGSAAAQRVIETHAPAMARALAAVLDWIDDASVEHDGAPVVFVDNIRDVIEEARRPEE